MQIRSLPARWAAPNSQPSPPGCTWAHRTPRAWTGWCSSCPRMGRVQRHPAHPPQRRHPCCTPCAGCSPQRARGPPLHGLARRAMDAGRHRRQRLYRLHPPGPVRCLRHSAHRRHRGGAQSLGVRTVHRPGIGAGRCGGAGGPEQRRQRGQCRPAGAGRCRRCRAAATEWHRAATSPPRRERRPARRILAPEDGTLLSVNGKGGAVVLDAQDVGVLRRWPRRLVPSCGCCPSAAMAVWWWTPSLPPPSRPCWRPPDVHGAGCRR